jgi:hypothetical protein
MYVQCKVVLPVEYDDDLANVGDNHDDVGVKYENFELGV